MLPKLSALPGGEEVCRVLNFQLGACCTFCPRNLFWWSVWVHWPLLPTSKDMDNETISSEQGRIRMDRGIDNLRCTDSFEMHV